MRDERIPSLIRLPNGVSFDPRERVYINPIDRDDDYPGIKERVVVTVGPLCVVIDFPTFADAVKYAERLADRVDEARGYKTEVPIHV